MRRLSSNLTIFLKLFIPLVYIVFFGSVVIGSFLITINDSPLLANPTTRLIMLGVYIIFIVLFYLTTGNLKRVDADTNNIYVSNYRKTFKYPWSSVKKMSTINLILFDIIYIHFHEKATFGKKIYFLASRSLVKSFFVDHPELFIALTSIEAQES